MVHDNELYEHGLEDGESRDGSRKEGEAALELQRLQKKLQEADIKRYELLKLLPVRLPLQSCSGILHQAFRSGLNH